MRSRNKNGPLFIRSSNRRICRIFSPPRALVAVSVTDAAPGHTKGRPVKALTPELQTGDYVWHPEVSPAGPVVVFVSLPDQVLYVYRNGVRIGRSTVSTGKHGQAGQGHANGSFHGAAEES
jgi:hypothetical protein